MIVVPACVAYYCSSKKKKKGMRGDNIISRGDISPTNVTVVEKKKKKIYKLVRARNGFFLVGGDFLF